MKGQILALLREKNTYVSGQELCERFGVSRTAVWKAVEQLKKEGHVIEAVRNKGYLLRTDKTQFQDVFTKSEIASRLTTAWAGHPLFFYESVDSTNTQAKLAAEKAGKMVEDNRTADEAALHGALFVTDAQTAGKGRRGRAWESPAGSNVYFTILLRPLVAANVTPQLTLVMAHAVAMGIRRTLQDMQGESRAAATDFRAVADAIGIKWPNDIVIGGKKVCGILTEMSLSVEAGSVEYVVIGVGINVKHQAFAEALKDKATSLEDALQDTALCINRSALVANIMAAFEADYGAFLETNNLARLLDSYNAMLVNKGREVCILDPKGQYRAFAKGINEKGELLVELPDGSTENIYSGEVSVRGIYGYV